MSILTIILNIFLPPVSVALNKGLGKDFIINVILTILGVLPGVIHAFYVTSK
ncbi:YqaE/Pmp3 family membrane protein [Nonlabens antarcticus]|uniref:YqaE/Pmp3 family membrane protein n=1 Tax=Nonlabens antarcticus TaxID=392714 RepID=UPI001891997B|nr:YqaE/Pmp3 family membrane protein [Nonlabens antarcticus]